MLSAEPPRESVSLSRAWFSDTCTRGTCIRGTCIRGTCIRGMCAHASSCPRPYQPALFPVLSKSLWHQAPDGKDGISSYRVLSSELLFTVRVSKLCLMKGVPEFFTFEDSSSPQEPAEACCSFSLSGMGKLLRRVRRCQERLSGLDKPLLVQRRTQKPLGPLSKQTTVGSEEHK